MSMIDAQHPYPVQWIDRWQLADGRSVTVRPVLPQDEALEHEFVAHGLTPRSRYLRFQIGLRELPDATARYFTQIDYRAHFALIAETFAGERHLQVADARFVRDSDGASAEFGMAVADAWQGLGLGRCLLQRLVAAACAQGIASVYGDVLRDNQPMLALARGVGFSIQRHPDDARLLRVRRSLVNQPPTRADGAASRGSGDESATSLPCRNPVHPCLAWDAAQPRFSA